MGGRGARPPRAVPSESEDEDLQGFNFVPPHPPSGQAASQAPLAKEQQACPLPPQPRPLHIGGSKRGHRKPRERQSIASNQMAQVAASELQQFTAAFVEGMQKARETAVQLAQLAQEEKAKDREAARLESAKDREAALEAARIAADASAARAERELEQQMAIAQQCRQQ